MPEKMAAVAQALLGGIKDFFGRAGFSRAVLGLSGGIDSAVAAVLAAQALGAENVRGLALPSPYSPPESVRDARQLAQNLGIDFQVIEIGAIYTAFVQTLETYWGEQPFGLTEENLQARIRGNLLMAVANREGSLLLNTTNKSEKAVGYCTLYGDLCGALAVLSEVPKTMVYQLAAYFNRERELIPAGIIKKAPAAELRPGQKDEDSLPPYEILDEMLELYGEENLSPEELVERGFRRETVTWLVHTIAQNEYKKKQMPPGLKITTTTII